MRGFFFGLMLGVLLALLLRPSPVEAQAPRRIYGTTAAGLPIALQSDASGNLKVVGQ
jgi:hypothetical protein